MSLRDTVVSTAISAIESVLPEQAVREALSARPVPEQGTVVLIAVGKAAWRMADAVYKTLCSRISRGCVITKGGHSMGPIGKLEIFEAAHPVPEERNLEATRRALSMVGGLQKDDTVLFLISGGASALFELPQPGVSLNDVSEMTAQLLASGANIVEINTLRKRVSSVKAGRFALACRPASVRAIVLSDVLGDRLDSIASGPAHPDPYGREDALAVVEKYKLHLPRNVMEKLDVETPKSLDNVTTQITGSVSLLCQAANESLTRKGFSTVLLTTSLDCEAASAGSFFAAIAREAVRTRKTRTSPLAFIAGGETVVRLKGQGKGGRCQEIALSASLGLRGLEGTVLAALGSDGTDGPTDAAGGIVDGSTAKKIRLCGLNPEAMLEDNDAYNALKAAGDLFTTGPTGTNVNDLIVLAVE